MANNINLIEAYQINQQVIPIAQVTKIGLPTVGIPIFDCSTSPNCLLSTGASVYSFAQLANGDKYYFHKTIAEMATLINA
jgi:hypothetical protein